MSERAYRQRLEADLAQWEADGVITPAVLTAIRSALPPLAPGINIPVVVGIIGGLLIAAAFLAFVAAHWTDIARLLRFAILVAGLLASYGLGVWLARAGRPVLADLCASVGSIIFGAGIALVGQMYHLGEDFAGAMLLWAGGALAAAALTGSRGAFAVALAAGSIWSTMRASEAHDVPHLAFVAFWLIAAGVALAWRSRAAVHLVVLAAICWWITAAVQSDGDDLQPLFVLANGAALLLGGGLALAARPQTMRYAGDILSAYGAFSLAGVAILEVALATDFVRNHAAASQPSWTVVCGVAGAILAFAAAATTRRAGTTLAGAAIGLVLLAGPIWTPPQAGEPWPAYAVLLCAMLCLVVSGVLDAARPRLVAGWLGIAGVIAGITWGVKGSLLRRSVFLAVAGAVAIAIATVLDRLRPRTEP